MTGAKLLVRTKIMALWLGAFIMIFPIWWIFSTSFETSQRAYSFPGVLWPQWILANYTHAWSMAPWGRFFLNSIFISGTTTLLSLLTALVAGFAFAYYRFRGKNAIFLVVLGSMLVPFEALLIPNYLIVKQLGWVNSFTAQIIPFAASGFGIFLLRQFILSLPRDLRDAARVDGASDWHFLWRIVVPNIRPALATVGIYLFLLSWNAFLWPLVVTNSSQVQPLQVGLANFLMTANGTDWTVVSAAAAFTTLPVLILFVIAQRQIVEAISRTGLKG